ncbi:MAG: hypothetical protein ABJM65_16820 [Ascidiaceihabitans sp.]|uniref:hypothetical protein n=1 Tax=Ascidiaceihabitans sp. TaxID=1872644 RepID=UPI003296E7B3
MRRWSLTWAGVPSFRTPREAAFDGMPNNIIFNDHPEKILPAADLGRGLTQELGETE